MFTGEGGSNKHGAAALIPEQVSECASFVDGLAAFLRASARDGSDAGEGATADLSNDLVSLRTSLQGGTFPTLPKFSRALRQLVTAIDDELTAKAVEAAGEGGEVVSLLKVGVSIVDEFLSRWTALVPRLRELKTAATAAAAATAKKAKRAKDREQRRLITSKAAAGDGTVEDTDAVTTTSAIVATTVDANAGEEEDDDEDEEEEDNEHVEQEGCPDENDFNKWSHHCSVQTCDDEVRRYQCCSNSCICVYVHATSFNTINT